MVSLRPHSQVLPLYLNILYLVFNVDVSTADLDRLFPFFEYVPVCQNRNLHMLLLIGELGELMFSYPQRS